MSDERRFRVLRGQSRAPREERVRRPESLPWSLVEQWCEQAEYSYGQTLDVLHSRGGLTPEDLWLAAHGMGLFVRPQPVTEREAGEWLIRIAAQAEASQS